MTGARWGRLLVIELTPEAPRIVAPCVVTSFQKSGSMLFGMRLIVIPKGKVSGRGKRGEK